MNRIKCARLSAVMAVAVLTIASTVVMLDSNDGYADTSVEVDNFADLQAALLGDNVTVDVVGDILVDDGISVKSGSRLNVRAGYTLTIDGSAMLYNYGEIFVKGTLINNGDLINCGNPAFSGGNIDVDPDGTLTGTVDLAITDIETTTRGSNVFEVYYHGVGMETITFKLTTSSADPGTYEYATILSDGKYTIEIEDGSTYTYDIYSAGKFTVDPADSVYPPVKTFNPDEQVLTYFAAALIAISLLIILMAAAASRRSKKQ